MLAFVLFAIGWIGMMAIAVLACCVFFYTGKRYGFTAAAMASFTTVHA